MFLVDAGGLPVAVYSTSTGPYKRRLVQELFDFLASPISPERIIRNKAYDRDALDDEFAERSIELISPHRANRRPENPPNTVTPIF